jgi:hypothetical protein
MAPDRIRGHHGLRLTGLRTFSKARVVRRTDDGPERISEAVSKPNRATNTAGAARQFPKVTRWLAGP